MFAHSFAAFILILPVLTTASILPHPDALTGNGVQTSNDVPEPTTVDQCNTGPIQCCNQVQTVSSSSLAGLLRFFGAVVGAPTDLIGHNCSPISFFGATSGSCKAQPMCCTNNHFNGLIVVGCNPVML